MAFGGAAAWTLFLQGKNFFVCLGAAVLVGAGVAMALGIPALRIKGPFLAVTTLAFALATGTYFLNDTEFPWLDAVGAGATTRAAGAVRQVRPRVGAHLLLRDPARARLRRGVDPVHPRRRGPGACSIATRDNSRAAQSYGISPARAQLTAFGLSGVIAGLAGGLYLFHQHQLSSTVLDPIQNIVVFSIGVLGGLGSVVGALLGAGYLYFVNYSSFTKQVESRLFASGVGLLLVMMIRPDGLGGAFYAGRDALLRRIAARKGIVVPSLLADVRRRGGHRCQRPR